MAKASHLKLSTYIMINANKDAFRDDDDDDDDDDDALNIHRKIIYSATGNPVLHQTHFTYEDDGEIRFQKISHYPISQDGVVGHDQVDHDVDYSWFMKIHTANLLIEDGIISLD